MATYGEKRKVFLLVFSSILVPPPSCGLRKEKFAEIEERGRHLQTLGRTNYNFVDDGADDDIKLTGYRYDDTQANGRIKIMKMIKNQSLLHLNLFLLWSSTIRLFRTRAQRITPENQIKLP